MQSATFVKWEPGLPGCPRLDPGDYFVTRKQYWWIFRRNIRNRKLITLKQDLPLKLKKVRIPVCVRQFLIKFRKTARCKQKANYDKTVILSYSIWMWTALQALETFGRAASLRRPRYSSSLSLSAGDYILPDYILPDPRPFKLSNFSFYQLSW